MSQAQPQHISVIIPVYNGARYLAEAVASIQQQTTPVSEIIIVDDASTDDTPAVIAGLAAADGRLRHARLPNQGGAGAARNHGVGMATGDLLAFLDADDLWLQDAVAARLAILNDDAAVDMAIGYVRQFFSPDLDEQARQATCLDTTPRTALLPGGILIRRGAFDRVGGFREDVRVGEFVDWYIRSRRLHLYEIALPVVTLLRRIHAHNLTRAQALYHDYALILKANLDDQRAAPQFIPLLREIFASRSVKTAAGAALPLHSNVEADDCHVLQHLLRSGAYSRIIEVGCAYGISALALLSAAEAVPGGVYHLIDPYQAEYWGNIGLENIRRAGFADRVTFHDLPSEIALPRLLDAGETIDFAFIDGNHTFDHVLVDFFFVNKMLQVGGMVVFDDAQMASQARLMAHIATYPAYERLTVPQSLMVQGQRLRINNPGRFGVFRKIAPDERLWSWHADF